VTCPDSAYWHDLSAPPAPHAPFDVSTSWGRFSHLLRAWGRLRDVCASRGAQDRAICPRCACCLGFCVPSAPFACYRPRNGLGGSPHVLRARDRLRDASWPRGRRYTATCPRSPCLHAYRSSPPLLARCRPRNNWGRLPRVLRAFDRLRDVGAFRDARDRVSCPCCAYPLGHRTSPTPRRSYPLRNSLARVPHPL
jgi:hypothetical protein